MPRNPGLGAGIPLGFSFGISEKHSALAAFVYTHKEKHGILADAVFVF